MNRRAFSPASGGEADWLDAYRVNRCVRAMSNDGELMRDRHREDTRLIGFSTYSGTVTAASE